MPFTVEVYNKENGICGHNFTQMKFWPFEGKRSEIDIYPVFDRNN